MTWLSCASVALGLLNSLSAFDGYADLTALYRHDPSTRLDLKLTERLNRQQYKIYDISYANPMSGRTQGYLVVPLRSGRKPAIIWLHSAGPISRLGDAILMAEAGAISLLVNPPGPPGPSWEDAESTRDFFIQTVIGLRRAVDVLVARDDVDAAKIGFAGHSGGAMLGAVATSIDSRFRVAVYEVGLLGFSIHIGKSPDPWAEGIRQAVGNHLDHYLQVISVVDAANYMGNAPAIPKLFQSAYFDPPGVPHEASEAFFRAATPPKILKWYDTGHELDSITATSDRLKYLGKALGMKDVNRVIRLHLQR